jgi:ubiquinone/menaquinone biosynthesis C-methylase UbiE
MPIAPRLKSFVKRQIKKVVRFATPPRPALPAGQAPHEPADVRSHYETFGPAYQEVYGAVYQAARSFNIEDLLQRELESAQFADGQRVLDAGCGVCGPAIWFAQHKQMTIDAVTISPTQQGLAQKSVAAAGLNSRISVHLGDFHRLEQLFPADTFDRVYFLESLCHANNYERVLTGAYKVLKPGGCLYVKDYLKRDLSYDPAMQERADGFLAKAYAEYHFNLIHRKDMLDILKKVGYAVEFQENNPYSNEQEDLSVQVGFEQKVGFHWREGLDLCPIDSIEIRARKV